MRFPEKEARGASRANGQRTGKEESTAPRASNRIAQAHHYAGGVKERLGRTAERPIWILPPEANCFRRCGVWEWELKHPSHCFATDIGAQGPRLVYVVVFIVKSFFTVKAVTS